MKRVRSKATVLEALHHTTGNATGPGISSIPSLNKTFSKRDPATTAVTTTKEASVRLKTQHATTAASEAILNVSA